MSVRLLGYRFRVKFGDVRLVDEDYDAERGAAEQTNWIVELPTRMKAEPHLCALIFFHGQVDDLAAILDHLAATVSSDRVLAIGFGAEGFKWDRAHRFTVLAYPHEVPSLSQGEPMHSATAALFDRLSRIAELARGLAAITTLDSAFAMHCRELLGLATAVAGEQGSIFVMADVPIGRLREMRALYVLGPDRWDEIVRALQDKKQATVHHSFIEFEKWYLNQCQKKKPT